MSAGTLSQHAIAGWSFKATARTAAHLEHTIEELKVAHPKARLVILQACYSDPVKYPLSAGTHDYDAVFDFEIVGLDWWAAQRFLRSKGWACWFRHTGTWAAESRWHIHAISLGYPGKVGYYVDGGISLYREKRYSSQVDDYYRHAFGLANQHRTGSDTSLFPVSIRDTVFDYDAYLARKAAGVPTYLDITIGLARLADSSKNPRAVTLYMRARSIIGRLVTDGEQKHVPATTAEVVAALKARRTGTKNLLTRARITAALTVLKPIT